MDRFFTYLLGTMAALLLVGLAFMFFPRASAPPDPSAVPAATPTASATPVPSPTPVGAATGDLLDPTGTLPPFESVEEPLPSPGPGGMPTPLPWTPPALGTVKTVVYPGFSVVYSETLGSPVAAQYAMVNNAKPKRYTEPVKVRTPAERLITAAGYARGPLALPQSIGLYFGRAAIRNTELMTNLSPMNPTVLRDIWSQFSALEKAWAGDFGWIEIVTGPVLGNPPLATPQNLVVPVAYFRAYRRSFGDTIAFLIPQDATSTDLSTYLTSIATIEAATGVAIFTNTIDLTERENVAREVWRVAGAPTETEP